jgi:tyrosine-protein phosphatase SIW14
VRSHQGILRPLVIAAILALTFSVRPAVSGLTGPAPKIHIGNFGCVNPNYYRGAQPRGGDYADLAALGVRTVIDLTKDGDSGEAAVVGNLRMQFYRIPMTTREAPSVETIAYFLKLVSDPASQPVFVHCQGGRHRTGLMTAIYRMTIDGWSAREAFAEMKRYNFGADGLHPEFKKLVFEYQPDPALVPAPRGVQVPR